MPSPELDAYFASVFKPGAAILTSGFKGGGKTHTAMAICEQLVKGVYPSVGPVRVFTNVIFYHRVNGRLEEESPPGVTHITTMKELFPLLVDSLEANRDVVNILVLDEAQNFLNGDSNQVNASVMMKEFLGIIRKFRLVVWFLTPSARAIGPAFRNYLNDPKYPGNLTAKLKKDLGWNQKYIEENNLPYRPQELMLVKNFDSDVQVLRVPVTEWTQTRDRLKEGEYCYDHEASATFWMGDDFDWTLFSRQIGGVSSMRILKVIREFYSMPAQSAPVETPEQVKKRMEGDTAYNLVKSGMSNRKVAEILGISDKTVKKRIVDAGHEVPTTNPRTAQKGASRGEGEGRKGPDGDSARKTKARQVRKCGVGGQKSAPIYLSKEKPVSRGPNEEAIRTELSEEAIESTSHPTPIPDGKWSLPELRRAVKHCIGDDEE